MKIFCTQLIAINPATGKLVKWCGDNITAPNAALAQQWCNQNGKGYLTVIGELVAEIPTNPTEHFTDYEVIQCN